MFVQESADAARAQWRFVADQLRDKFPELSALMDEAENDVLAFMTFPRAHWTQIYRTNPLERLNAEIKRRTNVVGIFPNDASIVRLVGGHDAGAKGRVVAQPPGHGCRAGAAVFHAPIRRRAAAGGECRGATPTAQE